MAVQVYKWTDDQAPVLVEENGRVKALLKACLVTGYGTKAPAGWTVAYETEVEPNIVFRQGGGPQRFFFLHDVPTLHLMDGCEQIGGPLLSDLGQAVNRFPTGGQSTFGIGAQMPGSAAFGPHSWVVVADNATCWYIFRGSDQTYWTWFGFGRFTSLKPQDSYDACVARPYNGFLTDPYLNRDLTGTVVSPTAQLVSFDVRQWALNGGPWLGHLPFWTGDQVRLCRVYIHDPQQATLRGWFRGVYGHQHPVEAFPDLSQLSGAPGSLLEGRTLLGFLARDPTSGVVGIGWFDVTGPWD